MIKVIVLVILWNGNAFNYPSTSVIQEKSITDCEFKLQKMKEYKEIINGFCKEISQ